MTAANVPNSLPSSEPKSVDEAYDHLHEQLSGRLAAGSTLAGYKIGLTGAGQRATYGVEEPTYGYVLGETLHETGETVRVSDVADARVEPELFLVLGSALSGSDVTAAQARAAVAEARFGFEVVGTRYESWPTRIEALVADNTSAVAAVLGAKPPMTGTTLEGTDLSALTVRLSADGKQVAEGSVASAFGDPYEVVAWLARALARRDGGLEPGQVVLTGTITAPYSVSAGASVSAELLRDGDVVDEVSLTTS